MGLGPIIFLSHVKMCLLLLTKVILFLFHILKGPNETWVLTICPAGFECGVLRRQTGTQQPH